MRCHVCRRTIYTIYYSVEGQPGVYCADHTIDALVASGQAVCLGANRYMVWDRQKSFSLGILASGEHSTEILVEWELVQEGVADEFYEDLHENWSSPGWE